MATIDLDLKTICSQRTRNLLYTSHPTRYDPPNIYDQIPKYTKLQLDMRRKAEILSYNPSKSNTQTNSLSRKQKFAQIIKGTNINKTSLYTCLADTIPQPTSSSGVPGPIVYLVNDPTVPLYNYNTKTNAYGILNTRIEKPWEYFTDNSVQCYNRIITKLFTLKINNTIEDYAHNYNFQTPIQLFFSSESNNLISHDDFDFTYKVKISAITMAVLYNGNKVPMNSEKPYIIAPVSNFPEVEIVTRVLENNPSTSFDGQLYLGVLHVSDLYLPTQPGYIYDVQLTFTLSITQQAESYSWYNDIVSGVYCNNNVINKIQNNCIIKTIASNQPTVGFYINGS